MTDGGISLQIKPGGLDALRRRIAAAAVATQHPAKLMKAIGRALESSTKRRFRAGLGPDGTPWKPSLRVKLRGGKTLLDRGRLRDSISSDGDDERAIVGTNLIYARIQQLGGVIEPKNAKALRFEIPGLGWRMVRRVTLPARPYLGVSDDDRVEIADQVASYLRRAVA